MPGILATGEHKPSMREPNSKKNRSGTWVSVTNWETLIHANGASPTTNLTQVSAAEDEYKHSAAWVKCVHTP